MTAYFFTPSIRLKNAALIAASLVFYAWGEPVFVLLIIAMAVFNYAAAIVIDAREAGGRKLGLALAVNVASAGVV